MVLDRCTHPQVKKGSKNLVPCIKYFFGGMGVYKDGYARFIPLSLLLIKKRNSPKQGHVDRLPKARGQFLYIGASSVACWLLFFPCSYCFPLHPLCCCFSRVTISLPEMALGKIKVANPIVEMDGEHPLSSPPSPHSNRPLSSFLPFLDLCASTYLDESTCS